MSVKIFEWVCLVWRRGEGAHLQPCPHTATLLRIILNKALSSRNKGWVASQWWWSWSDTYSVDRVTISSFSYSVCAKGRFNCTQEQCKDVNHCPGSLVYSPRSCLLTCSSLDPPGQQRGSDLEQSSCREPMSGCVCPQGTVLLVGEDHFF